MIESLKELESQLRQSRLLDAETVDNCLTRYSKASNALELAHDLVRDEFVTRWQAKQLLHGNSDFHIDDFLLLDQLGKGGMATVYKVRHQPTGEIQALKVLASDRHGERLSMSLFLRELIMNSSLRHPNIVRVYDAVCDTNMRYYSMEFVEGRDLRYWIDGMSPLPIDWACEIGRQIALGLQYAHTQGFVHQDIKPENILITFVDARPVVKILDMGISTLLNEVDPPANEQHTQSLLGTPAYIAPEQLNGIRQGELRSDIYSLGCTLFEMICGEQLWIGENKVEILRQKTNRDAVRLSDLRDDIPPELDNFVAQMLSRKPQLRPATAMQVAVRLQKFSPGELSDPGFPSEVQPNLLGEARSPGHLLLMEGTDPIDSVRTTRLTTSH